MSEESAPETSEITPEIDPADRIAALEAKLEESDAQFLRARADYHNLKRRTEEEKEGLRAFLSADLLGRLLPVVDNLERAIASADTSQDFDSFLDGIQGIRRQLADLLEREGVEAMLAVGQPFDPNLHNAILRDEASEAPENTVVEEFQRGYLLGGRVLRAAMVKVSAG
ncbi:MAG: nucleotide exchange factor GrpE [Armatimonadota bacterium]